MTRTVTTSLALALIALLVLMDVSTAAFNPYGAPAPFALGSGVQSDGAFCAVLPE
ncbi:MAG: hypothetical protein OXE84_00450 [Rhodobacteraceae bacterium]|nr:hypothetical protein [Paracoccaceae bacterium]MCY4196204.1 hypothetical protein [Paracoccaceae bacterium]MCY4327167.1 hypothetical protein [Paracoccaceae bacterium]